MVTASFVLRRYSTWPYKDCISLSVRTTYIICIPSLLLHLELEQNIIRLCIAFRSVRLVVHTHRRYQRVIQFQFSSKAMHYFIDWTVKWICRLCSTHFCFVLLKSIKREECPLLEFQELFYHLVLFSRQEVCHCIALPLHIFNSFLHCNCFHILYLCLVHLFKLLLLFLEKFLKESTLTTMIASSLWILRCATTLQFQPLHLTLRWTV